VAPQAATVALHDAVQQWPVPVVPHLPLVHWVFAEHTEPAASVETQVPEAPGFWQTRPDWQSLFEAHAVLHAVALAQMKPPAQGAAVPATHVFEALQVAAGVSVEPLHEAAAQSPFTLHCTQPTDALQTGVDPMQETGVALQVPVPEQVPTGVNMFPLHEADPHMVVLPGNVHAPVVSQPVAPHVPAVGEHAAVQQ
jgi:hypothetical protein